MSTARRYTTMGAVIASILRVYGPEDGRLIVDEIENLNRKALAEEGIIISETVREPQVEPDELDGIIVRLEAALTNPI